MTTKADIETLRQKLHVWDVSQNDLIVATSERNMRAIFSNWHGESIRGHYHKLLADDYELTLTDDSDDTNIKMKASNYARMVGVGYHQGIG